MKTFHDSFRVSPFQNISNMSNIVEQYVPEGTSKRRNSRKPEHPRTLEYRAMGYMPSNGDEDYTCPLNHIGQFNIDVYGMNTSEYARNFPSNIVERDLLWVSCDSFLHWRMLGHFNSLGKPNIYFYLHCLPNDTDSWEFELHVHPSIQPIICHVFSDEDYNMYISDTNPLCSCESGDLAFVDGMCADCYWEEDYQRKQRRRNFYHMNPDLHHAWAAHCGHKFFPNKEIIVSPLLCAHIPKEIPVDSSEYNSYIEKFKIAIQGGMTSVMYLLKEINPNYTPIE